MFLFIAILRMAYYFMKPHRSPVVLEITELVYHRTWPLICWIGQFLWLVDVYLEYMHDILRQFVFFLLLCATYMSLCFGSTLCSFGIWCWYWLKVFNVMVIQRPRECDRNIFQIFADPSRKQYELDAQSLDDRQRWDYKADIYQYGLTWRGMVTSLNERVHDIWILASAWLGPFDQFNQALFAIYASCLFGSSVCYFLLRILAYKFGFLKDTSMPKYDSNRGRITRWSTLRVSVRWKHRKKRKRRRKKGRRRFSSSFEASMLLIPLNLRIPQLI